MPASSIAATEARVVQSLVRAGGLAALTGAALTILWLIVMIAAPLPASGTASENLLALRADDARRSLLFLVVLPLGLILVPVWIALAARGWRAHPVAASLTVTFGLMYAPLSTVAYWMQLTVARGLADAYQRDPGAAVAAFQLFDFGTKSSLSTALDIFGYAVLGLGTMAAASLLWSDGRLGRFAGVMFAASGLLSVAGAIGVGLRWSWLEIGVIASGVPFLAGIIVVAWMLWAQARLESGPAGSQAALLAA